MTTDDSRAYVETGWDFLANQDPRDYYARLRSRVNPRRATPFLGDHQLRSRFNTVKTGDQL